MEKYGGEGREDKRRKRKGEGEDRWRDKKSEGKDRVSGMERKSEWDGDKPGKGRGKAQTSKQMSVFHSANSSSNGECSTLMGSNVPYAIKH